MFVTQLGPFCLVEFSWSHSAQALYFTILSLVLFCWSFFLKFILLFAFLFPCFWLNKSNNIFLKSDLTHINLYQLQKISMLNMHLYILQVYSSILDMCELCFLDRPAESMEKLTKLYQTETMIEQIGSDRRSPNNSQHLCRTKQTSVFVCGCDWWGHEL